MEITTQLRTFVTRICEQCEARERDIFTRRHLRLATLEQIGDDYGLTRERIRQLHEETRTMTRRVLDQPELAELSVALTQLDATFGTWIPIASAEWRSFDDVVAGVLDQFHTDDDAFARSVIADFLKVTSMTERAVIREGFVAVASRQLIKTVDSNNVIDPVRLGRLLDEAGVATRFQSEFIKTLDNVQSFRGNNLLVHNKVDAAISRLAVIGQPVDLSNLLALAHCDNSRSVRNRVLDDPRIVRVTKSRVALASWGLDSYHGVSAEIECAIINAGGSIQLNDLIVMLAQTKQISRASIQITVSSAARFDVTRGIVRLLDDSEMRALPAPPQHDIVVNDDGTCCSWPLLIDRDVRRGSGRQIPNFVAWFMGLRPGDSRSIPIVGQLHSMDVTWLPMSASGATTGSLREQTAKFADNCVVICTFDKSTGLITMAQE